jgi:hypothetical protein
MSVYLVFRTFRRRQSDVESPIFEKLMQGFLKGPENGLQLRHLHAEWINSLKKASFVVVVASWCPQHHCWQSYVTVFKDFLLLSRYLSSNVAHFFYFFVHAHLIMPRVNKRRRHSPNDTQATFGTKINLWRWKGKSSEQKIPRNEWIDCEKKRSVHRMKAPTR